MTLLDKIEKLLNRMEIMYMIGSSLEYLYDNKIQKEFKSYYIISVEEFNKIVGDND